MSKRNVILLIIILAAIISGALIYFYFHRPTAVPGEEGEGTNFLDNFNPFGPTTPTTPVVIPPVTIPGETPPVTTTPETPAVKLTKISSMPVAGFGIFMKERFKAVPPAITTTPTTTIPPATTPTTTPVITKPTPPPTEFVPAIRYVARATGNIYETFLDAIVERKFSNTIIPKVYEASLSNKGQSIIMRYLKGDERTIETFLGTLPKEVLGQDTTENNEIKGSFLPENISDLSVSPDSLKIFYLFNTGDNAFGMTAGALGDKRVQVFSSAYTEWLSQWVNTKLITLTTKPSGSVPGYMYAIDPNKKDFNKILSGVNGLTTLTSPDGKLILYGNNNLSLNIYHIDTREPDLLGIRTLPEKCIWGKLSDFLYCAVPKTPLQVQYPDSWYKGGVSFRDQIWKIDIKTGNTTLVIDPAEIGNGEEIDGIKLALDDGENYLFLVNKKDSFLWKLDLK